LLPYGQKLTLGLLATVALEIVPFHAYAPFPVVFSTTYDSASITSNFVKKSGLSVLSSIREIEKSRVGGDSSHVVFHQKFPGEKGSV
jgi:hypothetical protein